MALSFMIHRGKKGLEVVSAICWSIRGGGGGVDGAG